MIRRYICLSQGSLLLLFFLASIFAPCAFAEETQADPVADGTTLSLNQAIEMALKQNLSLNKTRLGVTDSRIAFQSKQADFNLKIVPTGLFEYTSSAQGEWHAGATISKKTPQGLTLSLNPEVVERGDGYETGVGAALNIPLLRGLGRAHTMDPVYSSFFSYENSKLSFYRQQVDVVLKTVNAVYGCIKTQQQIHFLEDQTNLLNGHLALAKIKEKNGLITATDLYRAEIRIKDVQDELANLKEQYANAVDQVKEILAIPQKGSLTVTASVELHPVDISFEQAESIALAHRIELEQGRLSIREARRKEALAKNNLLPQLDMNVRFNRFASPVESNLTDDSWVITLSSNTDLFRTVESNEYEQSKIYYRQAKLDFQEQRNKIVKDVRLQLNSLEKQKKVIKISREQIKQATGKLKLSESKFSHGMENNFDLLESQTQLQRARTNLLSETVNYIIGTYRLRSVIGTLVAREETRSKEIQ